MSYRYPAHIKTVETSDEEQKIQSVEEHCRGTAGFARRTLKGTGLEDAAYLAGLLHDMGKYSDQYNAYLCKAVAGEDVRRGSVNHTFAGVRFLLENYHFGKTMFQNMTSELLAYAAGAHHGSFDGIDKERKNGFIHRMNKEDIGYEEAAARFETYCAGKEELDRRFLASETEIGNCVKNVLNTISQGVRRETAQTELTFYMGLLARTLQSAVIDGDRKDTAAFLNGAVIPADRSGEERRRMWGDCLTRMEKKLKTMSGDGSLNQARAWISDQCRNMAESESGIYRLNVPTGGGKTLSALRFALAHAEKWQKKRIIFVSPLLSILEQNAEVIRSFVQDDSVILEHHSNFIQTEEQEEELDKRELLTETWESPILITTLVQLLNTMFGGRTTCIRRFHSLYDSVIVIDEVQTVPTKLLSMFYLTLNFLAESAGATIVLCSATQPYVKALEYPLHEPVFDMVPYREDIWSVFKRTEIKNEGRKSLDEIASFAKEVLEEADSLLVICNKKSESEYLYGALSDVEAETYHLSAAMCMQHRRDVLRDINENLKNAGKPQGRKIICVSTQVIEAGVDISFQRVIRLSAGMDSVIQAAGRCNRNAESGEGVAEPVYLISCKGEKLFHLQEIQAGKDATEALLNAVHTQPDRFRNDLSSEESIQYYFQKRYINMAKGSADYCVRGRDGIRILDLLSDNRKYADEMAEHVEEFTLRQAFKLAGGLFEVFDQETTDVLVPYKEGKTIITELESAKAAKDWNYLKEQLQKAKPYTISLFHYQLEKLEKNKWIHRHACGAVSLSALCYNSETGFSIEETEEREMDFLEV